MLHLNAQQRHYGDDSTPDPQELAELQRDLRVSRAERGRKNFAMRNDDPWTLPIDTVQPF